MPEAGGIFFGLTLGPEGPEGGYPPELIQLDGFKGGAEPEKKQVAGFVGVLGLW